MLNLVVNEIIKIFRQLSTYIMLGLLIVIVLAAGFILKFNGQSNTDKTDWKTQLTMQNQKMQKNLDNAGAPRFETDRLKQEIKMNMYRIEHNIPPIENRTPWGFVIPISNLISLIALFTIIISAGTVAGEFSSGTIKLFLIRPLQRWKLLLSKYISVLLFALGGLILLFITSFLVGGIFYGFTGVSQPYLAYTNGNVNEVNMVVHVIKTYGYGCVNLLMMVTFAFMVSAVFRNNSLAVGISLFLMFTGNILIGLLRQYGWVKYVLFANTDLTQYVDGTPLVKGMTMTFSLIVLAVYFIIFNATSWIVFSKRDVAA